MSKSVQFTDRYSKPRPNEAETEFHLWQWATLETINLKHTNYSPSSTPAQATPVEETTFQENTGAYTERTGIQKTYKQMLLEPEQYRCIAKQLKQIARLKSFE